MEIGPLLRTNLNWSLGQTFYNATLHANARKTPHLSHEIDLKKADPEMNIEIFTEDPEANLVLLLDYQRIPTYKKYDQAAMMRDLPWNSKGGTQLGTTNSYCPYYKHLIGFRLWNVDDDVIKNRTGRWFLTVMNLTTPAAKADLEAKKALDRSTVSLFHTNYGLRQAKRTN